MRKFIIAAAAIASFMAVAGPAAAYRCGYLCQGYHYCCVN